MKLIENAISAKPIITMSTTQLQQNTHTNNEARHQLAKFFASQKHPFHILRPSTLPLLTGVFLFCLLAPLVFYMHGLPLPVFDGCRSDIIHLSFLGLFGTVME